MEKLYVVGDEYAEFGAMRTSVDAAIRAHVTEENVYLERSIVVYAYKRVEIDTEEYVKDTVKDLIATLDGDYGPRDTATPEATEEVLEAGRALIAAVLELIPNSAVERVDDEDEDNETEIDLLDWLKTKGADILASHKDVAEWVDEEEADDEENKNRPKESSSDSDEEEEEDESSFPDPIDLRMLTVEHHYPDHEFTNMPKPAQDWYKSKNLTSGLPIVSKLDATLGLLESLRSRVADSAAIVCRNSGNYNLANNIVEVIHAAVEEEDDDETENDESETDSDDLNPFL